MAAADEPLLVRPTHAHFAIARLVHMMSYDFYILTTRAAGRYHSCLYVAVTAFGTRCAGPSGNRCRHDGSAPSFLGRGIHAVPIRRTPMMPAHPFNIPPLISLL